MFELESPKYFYLAALIPIVVALFLYNLFWKRSRQVAFADMELFKQLSPEKSRFKPVLKLVILLLALACVIISLVNPKMGTRMETVKRQGIDIVFAIDISKSMLAEDVAPNRLEKTKQLVSQIINQLGNDRVGIVGYAGSAYPVLPMTTDYSIAKMYLQSMNTNMVSSQGTAFNDAIKLSVDYFDIKDTSKLIILVSDGEDHGDGAEEAIEMAIDKGVRILTIGVGTAKGALIPLKDDKGTIVSYKKDQNGENVITKLYPEILQNIANKTKSKYIIGASTKGVIDEVKKALDAIEKTEFESQQIADFESQYQWFLGLGFLLLLLDVFLLEKKTKWVQKLNLFNEKKS
ncbi:VWA domain-containing protein [Flavobacterium cucumis]|uniref:Ca-activated chloride channel family protein n=1 Tax=Flavobacterium cucumis TaxID=416016 RepID=A0A1M7ZUG9_9FLAO|nr:VWA domain-containing protein [Flavobacterium cucumis]SHO72541.1 Ca-activated chloride channel family protein [Flavobacterium cucumis]